MLENNIRHLPVQTGGKLRGVITERDINFALAMDHKNPEELRVEEVYTEEPYVVECETGLDVVVKQMATDRIGCALITDKGKLTGIFTKVDACKVLHGLLAES